MGNQQAKNNSNSNNNNNNNNHNSQNQINQQSFSGNGCSNIDYYPIRLLPEQSVFLFGFLEAKTTLTWKDVTGHPNINLSACVACGMDTMKLYRMQPDIKEWIQYGKVSIKDYAHMQQWKPNPFTDLRCSIGDLVLHRKYIHPSMIASCGVTFNILRERYGLTKELMVLLRYSVEDWIDLEISEEFLKELNDDYWSQIFGEASKSDLIELAKRKALTKEP
jgi:hypothetical protein